MGSQTFAIPLRSQQHDMALDIFNTVDIIETMENYIDNNRPPENIRDKLDIGYRIEEQSIILFEIRPAFHDKNQKLNADYAKATYVKSRNIWNIYWLRSNLKWYTYDPKPSVNKLSDFLKIVEEDKYGCFKG